MIIEFEVHDKSSPKIDEVKEFWLRKWNEILQQLAGHGAEESLFHVYDYFYVLRCNGVIAAIMSSAFQDINQNFKQDSYYNAYPEAVFDIKKLGLQKFHKMGMIAAEAGVFPKDFKMTRIIIGCGMKFTSQFLSQQISGVVSFPRPDTSVYQGCVDWGAVTVKTGLTMYNVPVNFIVLRHSDLRRNHEDFQINSMVRNLWQNFLAQQRLYSSKHKELFELSSILSAS